MQLSRAKPGNPASIMIIYKQKDKTNFDNILFDNTI